MCVCGGGGGGLGQSESTTEKKKVGFEYSFECVESLQLPQVFQKGVPNSGGTGSCTEGTVSHGLLFGALDEEQVAACRSEDLGDLLSWRRCLRR